MQLTQQHVGVADKKKLKTQLKMNKWKINEIKTEQPTCMQFYGNSSYRQAMTPYTTRIIISDE